jgi:putative membrane protein
MEQWIANHIRPIVDSIIYAVLGAGILVVTFKLITMLMPFSVKKEIEEDQNTSLGIILAAVIIGLSMIISSAIKG